MSMLGSLAALIACQVGGEALHAALGIPVPGPVLGIGLLLVGLVTWSRLAGSVPALPAADALLSYLSLFFVPPGVGMVMQFAQLGRFWPVLAVAITASSILTLAVVGLVVQALLRRRTAPGPQPQRNEAVAP